MDKETTQTLWTKIRRYPDKKHVKGNVFFKLMNIGFSIIAKKSRVGDTTRYVYTIKPVKKNHFNGHTYVLINGGSFSASAMVAAYLRENGRSTFIGEETSGAAEGCNAGITPYYKLPNTNIKIRVPAFRIEHDLNKHLTGRGIIPNYTIEYTINDFLKRTDLEMKKVKELLELK
jgi:C-terminal processing protease CtpA/Prc